MAKKRNQFRCSECGALSATWTGRCSQCGGWATLNEVSGDRIVASKKSVATALTSHIGDSSLPTPTGFDEVDRVLGGGLVPGSLTLIHGEPGIGKSTLTLQMALSVASSGASVVLVSGEEAPSQIANRAQRFGDIADSLSVLDETDVDVLAAELMTIRPQLMIVDSIQTVRSGESESAAGSPSQIRDCAVRLGEAARRCGASLILIGHVTKDGVVAGPRLLEHLVDTVLAFTGDRQGELRFLRAIKHRYGPTNETGLFRMGGRGLEPVADPSEHFLSDRLGGAPGSVVAPVAEGARSMMVEIQALVTKAEPGQRSFVAQGIPTSRLKMLLAVLDQHSDISLADRDVFVSIVGGTSFDDSGLDLGAALAIVSSRLGRPLPPQMVFCGELGLAGEVRRAPHFEARLHEAYRMGFREAVVANSAPEGPAGLRLRRVATVSEAVSVAYRPAIV